MTATELLNITSEIIIDKIKNHKGLNEFVVERSKFEGWLKVEFVEALIKNGIKAKPEIDRIDISFNKTAIELKTINTNYRYNKIKNKTRPITINIKSIKNDIKKLKGNNNFDNKFVVFIVFPLETEQKEWISHLTKIKNELFELVFKEFKFNNGAPGVIYYGKI